MTDEEIRQMAEDEPDTGNPNFFTTYKGRYEPELAEGVTGSPYIMLSCINTVQFTSDYEVGEGITELMTVPDACRPSVTVYEPVLIRSGETVATTYIAIDVDGSVSIAYDGDGSYTALLAGSGFNISCNFYM